MVITTTTRAQTRNLRLNSPTIKLDEIAKITGVTKQRIWKILRDEDLPTVAVKSKKIIYCIICDLPTDGKKFCSKEHKEIHYYVQVPCHACGKIKKRLKTYIMSRINRRSNKNFYCNRSCFQFAHSSS